MPENSQSGMDRGRRRLLALLGGVGAGALAAGAGWAGWRREQRPEPIRVGVLHSLSGSLAISETPLCDAALLSIQELNGAGGVLGRPVEAMVHNGASDPAQFARRCATLLGQDGVCSIFGCWSSACRKAMLPVLARYGGLLWYPVQYEGNECSEYVMYTGSTPNQQIIPAVRWLLGQGRRRFYLLGSDYIYPRTANRVVRLALSQGGGAVAGEEYVPLGERDFTAVVQRIRAAQPEVVFSTVNGLSNRELYRSYFAAGIPAAEIPIMAMSVAEAEIRTMAPEATAGHYAAWAYFESLPGAANQDFVRRFKARYGNRRVTDDPIEAAYFQVKLWAQAVHQAGTIQVESIRQAAAGQVLAAPEGRVRMDSLNRHTWKWLRIGQILDNGQFAIRYSSSGPIDPDPWLATLNGGRNCNWETGQVEAAPAGRA